MLYSIPTVEKRNIERRQTARADQKEKGFSKDEFEPPTMSYLNTLAPHELTINELAELQSRPNFDKVLHHYKSELRKAEVQAFFKRYNGNIVGFEQEIQEEACRLNITQREWDDNRQMLDRIELERGGRSF